MPDHDDPDQDGYTAQELRDFLNLGRITNIPQGSNRPSSRYQHNNRMLLRPYQSDAMERLMANMPSQGQFYDYALGDILGTIALTKRTPGATKETTDKLIKEIEG